MVTFVTDRWASTHAVPRRRGLGERQVLMNGAHRCRPLAYSGRDAFDRAGAHVGNGKQSWIAGLERERPAPSTAISGNVTGDNGAQGHRFPRLVRLQESR